MASIKDKYLTETFSLAIPSYPELVPSYGKLRTILTWFWPLILVTHDTSRMGLLSICGWWRNSSKSCAGRCSTAVSLSVAGGALQTAVKPVPVGEALLLICGSVTGGAPQTAVSDESMSELRLNSTGYVVFLGRSDDKI